MGTIHMNNATTQQQHNNIHVDVLVSLLEKELRLLHPSLKDHQYRKCVSAYVHAVLQELATQWVHVQSDNTSSGEIDFSVNRVSEACGRTKINGRDVERFTLMQSAAATSLVVRVYLGRNITKRVSRITINPRYKKEIMNALQNLSIELNPQRLDDLESSANTSIDINPESLLSFIEACKASVPMAPNQEYEDKLTRNLLLAKELIYRAKEKNGVAYVDEYWEETDSGRIYGHGISLQRIPKEVRHAALGHCHKYDFKACSFALLAGLAKSFDPTIKVAAVTDYVTQRSVIRKRIAEDIGISEDWMKDIFTSLGFGAGLVDNPHKSIRGKLGAKKYNQLMSNPEFALIASQLDMITATIHAHTPNEGFVLRGKVYSPINPKDNRKRSKSQKLAWIYQVMESDALGLFMALIPPEYAVLLQVHDCIYLKHKLPSHHVADIKRQLMQQYPYLNFEHEYVIPIHANKDHGIRETQIDKRIASHKMDIAAQEEIAASSVTTDITEAQLVSKIITPFGVIDSDLVDKHLTTDSYFTDQYFDQSY